MSPDHFRNLERLYHSAPINKRLFETSSISISKGYCEIGLEISGKYFHGGDKLHGAIYFKLMDDASYFAISSEIEDEFLVTAEFNCRFLRPVGKGPVICKGRFEGMDGSRYLGRSELFDYNGKIVGKGSGYFVKSGKELASLPGYKNDET